MNKSWLEDLQRATLREPDKIPPGWYSIHEIAAALDCEICTASRRVKQSIAQKKTIEKKFMVRIKTGRLNPISFYKSAKP